MRSLGGPESSMTGVFIRKGDWDTDTQRKEQVRAQGEGGHLKPRGLRGDQSGHTLISKIVRTQIAVAKATLGYFAMVAAAS